MLCLSEITSVLSEMVSHFYDDHFRVWYLSEMWSYTSVMCVFCDVVYEKWYNNIMLLLSVFWAVACQKWCHIVVFSVLCVRMVYNYCVLWLVCEKLGQTSVMRVFWL